MPEDADGEAVGGILDGLDGSVLCVRGDAQALPDSPEALMGRA